MSIQLGDKVRDIITGYTGIAIARMDSLFCSPEIRLVSESVNDNGQPYEPVWFDESRLEIVIAERVKVNSEVNAS